MADGDCAESRVVTVEMVSSVGLGVGLAAACGFRVFLPVLIMGLAARAGFLEVTEGLEWMAATPALSTFAVAMACEVGAYYVSWLDNLLDTVAMPAAVAAGTLVSAANVETAATPLSETAPDAPKTICASPPTVAWTRRTPASAWRVCMWRRAVKWTRCWRESKTTCSTSAPICAARPSRRKAKTTNPPLCASATRRCNGWSKR